MPKKSKKQQAIDDAKYAALREAQKRNDLAWKYARIKFSEPQEEYDFVQKVEEGKEQISEEMVEQAVAADLPGRKLHQHCVDSYRQFHHLAYRNVNTYMGYGADDLHCEGCGEKLLCQGADQRHDFRQVSFEECQRRNIYHGGRSYHVSECVRCGYISSIDSSD